MATHQAFVELGLESPFDQQWLDRPGQDHLIVARIAVHNVRRRALLAHETQVDPESPFWFGLPDDVQDRLHPYDEYCAIRMRVPIEPVEDDPSPGSGVDGRVPQRVAGRLRQGGPGVPACRRRRRHHSGDRRRLATWPGGVAGDPGRGSRRLGRARWSWSPPTSSSVRPPSRWPCGGRTRSERRLHAGSAEDERWRGAVAPPAARAPSPEHVEAMARLAAETDFPA